MPEWLDYQKLAAAIYEDLAHGAVVTHNDRIHGHKTGLMRQIDVSIRTMIAGHEILVIVQAKDHAAPADINIVGEFQAVIEDVGAAKGVLICSGGFSKTAFPYAEKLGIDLCSVHDARTRRWALSLKIPLLWIEPLIDVRLGLGLQPDRTNEEEIVLNPDGRSWLVSGDGGRTSETLVQLIARAWDLPETPRAPGEQHELEIPCDGLRLLLGTTFWCPMESLTLRYRITEQGWQGTFTFSEVRALMNQSKGTLQARIDLTSKDIPLTRDPSWTRVEDPVAFEASHPNLVRLSKDVPTAENFVLDLQPLHEMRISGDGK